ncbi:glycosyltransferase [Desulfoglaeba alkanexedens]|uniref:Glycosyltransferase family 4 protein n=1 Tax=Desulfoglaeba alkanexedens ALDC TaxID=980445 RepID=A0A4P8L3X4_9BACT|nr:hypothetical protein FDQ92_11095 [Desulfoglaeba alkanexedens ALDC]
MGCGCPVIASDLHATRDVIGNGETGRAVSPGQSPSLAEVTCTALTRHNLMIDHSDCGRKWAHCHFDRNQAEEK